MSQDIPIGRTQVSLAQINERSREIFRQIVESYLTTGEPLGSRNLSRLITTPLSPASVRNVMADLEQLGLIYAPHTSAGRLPTELGLRFFVDALMQIGDLNDSEKRAIESQVAGRGQEELRHVLVAHPSSAGPDSACLSPTWYAAIWPSTTNSSETRSCRPSPSRKPTP